MSFKDPQDFSRIFPKTFAYLQFSVPMIYPDLVNKSIPDVKVILRQSDDSMKNNPAFFDPSRKVMVISLDEMLNFSSSLNIDRFNLFENNKDMEKLLKYIDSMPKFSSILIHEYTHLIQSNNALFGILRLADTPIADRMNYKQMPLYRECAGSLLGMFDKKYALRQLFKEYGFNPTEVEARLAQWIFYKIHNYDSYTIGFFDVVLPKKVIPENMESNINAINEEIRSINSELSVLGKYPLKNFIKIRGLKKKLRSLNHKKYFISLLLDYYPKMNREAENIAGKFREKYLKYVETAGKK